MVQAQLTLNHQQALSLLMRFLSIEGITGQEGAVAREVSEALVEVGVPRGSIRHDRAHERISLPTQTGNLIVTLPGNRPGPRRLFMAHLDTVPLAAGAIPVRKGNRIVPKNKTALGGDNRTGVACLVTLAATLLHHELHHPPLTLLFTVREESGLWGARNVTAADLLNPAMGFNVDGRTARELTIGAVGAERWHVEIFGKAAHAGVHPEQGISATMVASLALAQVVEQGWFGRVVKAGKLGTSNVGRLGGTDGHAAGEATNVITDYVQIHGESRSHDMAYRDAFQSARRQVTDDRGRCARVRFRARRDYYPYRIKENSSIVRLAQAAAQLAGWQLKLRVTDGGLDANWLVRHGIPTLTFGAGQNRIHTIREYVHIPDFLEGCRLALALAIA
jgi:tripeptide aminopeptidase